MSFMQKGFLKRSVPMTESIAAVAVATAAMSKPVKKKKMSLYFSDTDGEELEEGFEEEMSIIDSSPIEDSDFIKRRRSEEKREKTGSQSKEKESENDSENEAELNFISHSKLSSFPHILNSAPHSSSSSSSSSLVRRRRIVEESNDKEKQKEKQKEKEKEEEEEEEEEEESLLSAMATSPKRLLPAGSKMRRKISTFLVIPRGIDMTQFDAASFPLGNDVYVERVRGPGIKLGIKIALWTRHGRDDYAAGGGLQSTPELEGGLTKHDANDVILKSASNRYFMDFDENAIAIMLESIDDMIRALKEAKTERRFGGFHVNFGRGVYAVIERDSSRIDFRRWFVSSTERSKPPEKRMLTSCKQGVYLSANQLEVLSKFLKEHLPSFLFPHGDFEVKCDEIAHNCKQCDICTRVGFLPMELQLAKMLLSHSKVN